MTSQETKPRILVVDDDEHITDILSLRLEADGYDPQTCPGISQAMELLAQNQYSLVLLDLRLRDGNGVDALPRLREIDSDVPVFIITAHGDVDSAVQAFSRGANGYIRKPFQEGELRNQILNAVDGYRAKLEVKRLKRLAVAGAENELDKIIYSRDPAMRPLLKQLQIASNTNSNVVVYGASGTGKELVARALHQLGPRSAGPFVAINCGAFPETLLESELFGYTKGAFTDARADKIGHIIRANGGTLFLDEIGDAPLSIQVRLLRALQEREVLPLGASTSVKVDVRFIAATHHDLKTLIAEGKFREDLFYRLQVLPLQVPSLRDRPSDILYLASIFATKLASQNSRAFEGLTPAAAAAAQAYPWPGNVRELQNRVEHALVMGRGPQIDAVDLFPELDANKQQDSKVEAQTAEELEFVTGFQGEAGNLPPYKSAKETFERLYMEALLREAEGNIAKAARLAGKARTEVYGFIKKHGIDPNQFKKSG